MNAGQLNYIRTWAKAGNLDRHYDTIPSWCLHVTTRGRSSTERRLDVFAMTIARMADALQQANLVAECLAPYAGDCFPEVMAVMRANYKELLG